MQEINCHYTDTHIYQRPAYKAEWAMLLAVMIVYPWNYGLIYAWYVTF